MLTGPGTGEGTVATVVHILRWIAVLPGALIAAVLSLISLHIFFYLIFLKFFEVYPQAPERILSPAVLAGVFIWAGSKISPAYKFETAMVLFGIWMFVVGGFVFLTVAGTAYFGGQLYFRYGGMATVMAIVGAAIGLIIVRGQTQTAT